MEKVYTYTQTELEIFESIFKEEKLLMNHVVIPSGKVFPKHPTDAQVYVLITKGELSLSVDDKEVNVYGIGQLVHIPKHLNSELGNRGEGVLELFVVKYDYDK